MHDALRYLQDAVALAFVLLGLATAASWARRRERPLGFLALAIVLLSLVALLGRLPDVFGLMPPALPELSLIAFLGSAYALLRFRSEFVPLSRRWHAGAGGALVISALIGLSATFMGGAAPPFLQKLSPAVLVLAWSATVAEPAVRFWLAARGRPMLQKRRLQFLSLGLIGLVAILVGSAAGSVLAAKPLLQAVTQIGALLVVPLLYFSFAPPAWLRRNWRLPEEAALRQATEDLLLSNDREALARGALEWVMRLVGADAALAMEADGSTLANRGLGAEAAHELRNRFRPLTEGVSRTTLAGSPRTAMVLPLVMEAGTGALILLAGPFTPAFGADEVIRAREYATAVAAALDRASLIDRLQEANARLVEASRHKTVFLANMSHELRTPLNAILGFSELILDDPGGYDERTRQEFLRLIHSSGQHLLNLINDILDLSKVEAGQMELRLTTVSVSEVLEGVRRTVQPLAGKKDIELVVQGVEAELIADPVKMRQMLLNLVSNAIKFTPEGGRVGISASRMNGAIEIAVADSGIGIAEADRGRIFEEFRQLDTGDARQQPGTGLGLTLTRRFAELHGGHVRVESELGKGSVFTLSLPAPTDERRPAGLKTGAAGGADQRPLVLIVEDNQAAAGLLIRHLDRGGLRSEVAVTGSQAVAMARELRPAAITLDILLPELDGWEILGRLKRDAATRDIPVIVVSVVDNPELGRALGALDYFVKPVDGKALLQSLSRFAFTGQSHGESVSILIADDDAANRRRLSEILKSAGFTVTEAGGGREAIELARSQRPHLVLLDLMMPEVSGFDVVAALRADEATRSIPVMIVTAEELSEADKHRLTGNVAAVLSPDAAEAPKLVEWLEHILASGSPA